MAIPRAEVIVPPLCLNSSEPLPWPDNAADGLWRLACVARLEPRWKGQDVLFEVLADDKWKNRNFTLSLYGQGADEGYLKKLSRFYGLERKLSSPDFQNHRTSGANIIFKFWPRAEKAARWSSPRA
ncbi:MAG: hypothetical protein WDN00_08530 [Limisphaerales bacterium]